MDLTHEDEQLLEGIAAAINARDFDAVIAMLRVLAVQNPEAAQAVRDAVELAGVVAGVVAHASAHPESVMFAPAEEGKVSETTAVVARCGRHFVGPPRKLGRRETAGELIADFAAHRATYAPAAGGLS